MGIPVLYTFLRFVEGHIEMEPLEHTAMEEELNKPEYGESRTLDKMRKKKKT